MTFFKAIKANIGSYDKSTIWGRLDSNQRRPKSRDLQSLAIAAMRHPRREMMLAVGLEPTTVRLQVGCSTS